MYTADELSSADPSLNRGTINVSDDAAVALQYLLQVNEVTGDPAALSIAEHLLSSIQAFFADPIRAGVASSMPPHLRIQRIRNSRISSRL